MDPMVTRPTTSAPRTTTASSAAAGGGVPSTPGSIDAQRLHEAFRLLARTEPSERRDAELSRIIRELAVLGHVSFAQDAALLVDNDRIRDGLLVQLRQITEH